MLFTDTSRVLIERYSNESWKRLYNLNCSNIKNSSLTLFVINIFLLFTDYSNWTRGYWLRNPEYKILFFSHLILGICMLVYFFISTRCKIAEAKKPIFTFTFVLMLLNLAAFISGRVDQLLNGEVTVYIFICFFVSFFFYQKNFYTILAYFESFALFLILATKTQINPDIIQSHYLNVIIVVLLACLVQVKISKIMLGYYIYRFNLESILKEHTIKLKKYHEKVQRLDQLNLIGELAATVGDEIRNPLTTIRGFIQLLSVKQKDPLDLERFDLLISEIDKANKITEEFLAISRTKATIMETGNISATVKSIMPFIEAEISNKGMVVKTDTRVVPDNSFNKQEICQLLLNLARNGMEAMKKGGLLTISVYSKRDEVVLAVKDEGTGIASEDLEKLGTPFFSTKDTAAGLGLVVCNSIIERHKGRMEIRTGPHGSTFEVHFKLSDSTAVA